MASPEDADSDVEETVKIDLMNKVKEKPKWDPFQSPDWDAQKPSSEAIVRMKRQMNHYYLYNRIFVMFYRDLHGAFSDPLPGIFITPHGDDITRVSMFFYHVLSTSLSLPNTHSFMY